MSKNARTIVQEVFPPRMEKEIWASGFNKVLPITFNDFDISAVLPAVFYMFRFGWRRGHGKFLEVFAPTEGTVRERRREATIERIAAELATKSKFDGFEQPVERAILSDLLLTFSLENIRREAGRDKQVQRAAPTHYMASWIDLPDSLANLRFVPEAIVAMLANQDSSHVKIADSQRRTWFPVAMGHDQNLLLKAFNQGITLRAHVSDRAGDQFDEKCTDVGIDQLLTIRLAELLGEAPDRLRGEAYEISNQRPISERAAMEFSEDIRRFVRSYAGVIPRHGFVSMLEACVSTGMIAILTSTVEILFHWEREGEILEKNNQTPNSIFVDCSSGVNIRLRKLAEQSLDDMMRRTERVVEILTMLRLLDYEATRNNQIRNMAIPSWPYATEWLNMLGKLLHDRHKEAAFIHQQMDRQGQELADELQIDFPDTAAMLRDYNSEPNAVRRLALALTQLMGTQHRGNLMSMIDSTLNIDRPNGLARKRRTTRGANTAGRGRRSRDVRSLIFTDAVLDYLVHLHLLRPGSGPGTRILSFRDFMDTIRDRYGFHVDTAPPGMTISNELLWSNRMVLERRLRDLGLLVGVNDAEAMKRLRPRFTPRTEN